MGLVILNRDGLISTGAEPPAWFFLHKVFGGEQEPFFPWMDIFTLFQERNAKTVKIHSIWMCFSFLMQLHGTNIKSKKQIFIHIPCKALNDQQHHLSNTYFSFHQKTVEQKPYTTK